jgi:predicted DNA-binding transcriptional regulator AlpA
MAKPSAAPPPAPLLDKKEVAVLFGISTRTVEALTARNLIPPPVRIGNQVRFDRAPETSPWQPRARTAAPV